MGEMIEIADKVMALLFIIGFVAFFYVLHRRNNPSKDKGEK